MTNKIKVFVRKFIKQDNKNTLEAKCVAYNHDPCKMVYFNHFETLGDHTYTCLGCGKQTNINISMEERMPEEIK